MDCARCGHSEEKHCKSGVKHVNHKQEMWPVPNHWHICAVKHCLLALCSCVDFVAPQLFNERETAEDNENWLCAIARDDRAEQRANRSQSRI